MTTCHYQAGDDTSDTYQTDHNPNHHGSNTDSDDDSSDEPLTQLFFAVKSELLRNIRDNLSLKLEIRSLKEKFLELLKRCEQSNQVEKKVTMQATGALECINEEDTGRERERGRDWEWSRVSKLTQHYNQLSDMNSNYKTRARSLERTRNRYRDRDKDRVRVKDNVSHTSRYKGHTSGYESSSSSIRSCGDVLQVQSDSNVTYDQSLSVYRNDTNAVSNKDECLSNDRLDLGSCDFNMEQLSRMECYDLDKEYDTSTSRHTMRSKHRKHGYCNIASEMDDDNQKPALPPRNTKLLNSLRQNSKSQIEKELKEFPPPPLPPREFKPHSDTSTTGYSSTRTVKHEYEISDFRPQRPDKAVTSSANERGTHPATNVQNYNASSIHNSHDTAPVLPARQRHKSAGEHRNINDRHYFTHEAMHETNDLNQPLRQNSDHQMSYMKHDWTPMNGLQSHTLLSGQPPPLPPRNRPDKASRENSKKHSSVVFKKPRDAEEAPPPLPPRTHVTRSSTDSMRSQSSYCENRQLSSSTLPHKPNHLPMYHHAIKSSTDSAASQQSHVGLDSMPRGQCKYVKPPKRPDKPASLKNYQNKLSAKSAGNTHAKSGNRKNGYNKLDHRHSKVPADFDDSLSETSDSIYNWSVHDIKGEPNKSESSLFENEENLQLIYQMSQEFSTDQESTVDMESIDDPTSCSQSQFFQEYHPKHQRCPDHQLHVALGEPCSYYLEDKMSSSMGSCSSAWYEEESVLSSEPLSSSASSESLNSMGSIEDSMLSESNSLKINEVRRSSLPHSIASSLHDGKSVSSSVASYSKTADSKSQVSSHSYPTSHADTKSIATTLHSDSEDFDNNIDDVPNDTNAVEAKLPDENPMNGEESPTSSLAVTCSSVSDLNSVSTPNGSQSTPHQSNGSVSEASSPAFQLPLINLHDGLPRMRFKQCYSPSLSSSDAQGMMAPINSPQMTDSGGSRMSFASGSRWSYAGSRISFSTMTDSGGSRLSCAGSRFSYLSNVTDFSAGSRYSYAVSTCTEQPDDYVELSKINPPKNRSKRIRFQTPPHMLPGEITPTHIPAHVLMEGFKKEIYSASSESDSDKNKQTNSSSVSMNASTKQLSSVRSTTDTNSVSGSITGTDTNSVSMSLSQEQQRKKNKSLRKKLKHFTNSFYRVNKSTGNMDIKTLGMV